MGKVRDYVARVLVREEAAPRKQEDAASIVRFIAEIIEHSGAVLPSERPSKRKMEPFAGRATRRKKNVR